MLDLVRAPPGRFILSREIAERSGIPFPYLGKLLQQLTAAGLLEATRGRGGGYRLALPPQEINVRQIMNALDGGKTEQECLLGLKTCADETACALHCQWRPVKENLLELLDRQSLAGLV